MIELKNVCLQYPLMERLSYSLHAQLAHNIGGILSKNKQSSLINYVEALKDINLTINDGERLGIIGHNGAGKTTLLRLLSGVYPPTSGTIKTTGNISSLTDLTLGMDEEASGIKNIIFRLVFMGHSYNTALKAVDEIVDFSELGDFINFPIRTYSSGMMLRLAFAISTHFVPDILLLDEIVGTGDQAFMKKSQERLNSFLQQSRIVVLCSHSNDTIAKYCNTAILLQKGAILRHGKVNEVIEYYQQPQS